MFCYRFIYLHRFHSSIKQKLLFLQPYFYRRNSQDRNSIQNLARGYTLPFLYWSLKQISGIQRKNNNVISFPRHSRHPGGYQKASGAADCGLQQQPDPAAAGGLQPVAGANRARPQ